MKVACAKPVQKRRQSESKTPSRQSDSRLQLKESLRGLSYDEQCAALRPVQQKGPGSTEGVHQAAAEGVKGAGGTLPYADKIQEAFGKHDISSIQAYQGGNAKGACESMGAEAYASGDSVAFKGSPTLHTAAHEAAHIVQQRGGVSLKGGVGAAGDPYEQHADAVADLVVQGKSAEGLLDTMAGPSGSLATQNASVQKEEAWKPKQHSIEDLEVQVRAYLSEGDAYRAEVVWKYLKSKYPDHKNPEIEAQLKPVESEDGPDVHEPTPEKPRDSVESLEAYVQQYIDKGDPLRAEYAWKYLKEVYPEHKNPQLENAYASLLGPQPPLNSGQKARLAAFGQIVLNNLSQNYRRNAAAVSNFQEWIKVPKVPNAMAKTLWDFIVEQGVDTMIGAIPGAAGKLAGIAKKAIKEVQKQKASVAKYNNAIAIAEFSTGLTSYFESSVTAQENLWDGENAPEVAALISECTKLPPKNREAWLSQLGKSFDFFRTADLNVATQEKAIFDMWIHLQSRIGKGPSDKEDDWNRQNNNGEVELMYECDPSQNSFKLVSATLRMAGASGTIARMQSELQKDLSRVSELNMRKRVKLRSTEPLKFGHAWGAFRENNEYFDSWNGNPLESALATKMQLTRLDDLPISWSKITPK